MYPIVNFIQDMKKIFIGFLKAIYYVASTDRVTISISFFRAYSSVVRKGESCRYDIVLADNGFKNDVVKIMVDIYSQAQPRHPEGHFAYFTKTIHTRSHSSTKIQLSYDWQNNVFFTIENVDMAADLTWIGSCKLQGKYVMSVVLFDEKDNFLEKTSLVQELSG